MEFILCEQGGFINRRWCLVANAEISGFHPLLVKPSLYGMIIIDFLPLGAEGGGKAEVRQMVSTFSL
jgi:hypothetical protein